MLIPVVAETTDKTPTQLRSSAIPPSLCYMLSRFKTDGYGKVLGVSGILTPEFQCFLSSVKQTVQIFIQYTVQQID